MRYAPYAIVTQRIFKTENLRDIENMMHSIIRDSNLFHRVTAPVYQYTCLVTSPNLWVTPKGFLYKTTIKHFSTCTVAPYSPYLSVL
jgi:hypothetical protein